MRPAQSVISFSARQSTSLSRLLEEICEQHHAQMLRQGVQCFVEMDVDATFPFEKARLRPAIEFMINDALACMPEGGELDITVCTGTRGLEIEVADSSDATKASLGRRAYESTSADGPSRIMRNVQQYEVAVCPQGGLARTLVTCWPRRRAAA